MPRLGLFRLSRVGGRDPKLASLMSAPEGQVDAETGRKADDGREGNLVVTRAQWSKQERGRGPGQAGYETGAGAYESVAGSGDERCDDAHERGEVDAGMAALAMAASCGCGVPDARNPSCDTPPFSGGCGIGDLCTW